MPARGLDHIHRSEYIVLNRLEDVRFHQRDVFISRGVIDKGQAMALKHLFEPRGVPDAANLRMEDTAWKIARDLQSQMEKRGYGDVIADDCRGTKAGDLTATLRTDGSRRARHENRLAAKLLRNAIMFQVHRGPGQQVLDCNVAGNPGAGKPFQDFFHSVRTG